MCFEWAWREWDVDLGAGRRRCCAGKSGCADWAWGLVSLRSGAHCCPEIPAPERRSTSLSKVLLPSDGLCRSRSGRPCLRLQRESTAAPFRDCRCCRCRAPHRLRRLHRHGCRPQPAERRRAAAAPFGGPGASPAGPGAQGPLTVCQVIVRPVSGGSVPAPASAQELVPGSAVATILGRTCRLFGKPALAMLFGDYLSGDIRGVIHFTPPGEPCAGSS